MNDVRTYPELNLRAIKIGKLKELRLWYLLRTSDGKGSGRLFRQEARYGMSYETLRRTLNSGKGTFWEVKPRKDGDYWIELRSPAKVCFALGVLKLSRDPVVIPVEHFSSTNQFRIFCHHAWHAKEDANPISRTTMTSLSGAAKSTQVRYDKKTNAVVTKNRVLTGRVSADGSIPQEMYEGGNYILSDGREVKTLPNSYYVDLKKAPRGRIRHINRELKARQMGRETEIYGRRYFQTAKDYSRCKHRHETSYLLAGEYREGHLWEKTY